jgi:hypothetical protein
MEITTTEHVVLKPIDGACAGRAVEVRGVTSLNNEG